MAVTTAVLVLSVDENGDGQWQWHFPEMTTEQKRAFDRLWLKADRPAHMLTVAWHEVQPPYSFGLGYRRDELRRAD